jgi:3'-phosphoadenosine 5'-phosphosulfate sulfotransferase (PAPS reductase)/FAD synthetase
LTKIRRVKKYISWGFGQQSTALAVMVANKDPRLKEYWYAEIIASDPGHEMDDTYKIIPFYKQYFEDRGLKVMIIDRGYTLIEYFTKRQQVPMGWANPLCSSHFKRDLINTYYRSENSINGRLYKKDIEIIELLGITTDEATRAKHAKEGWKTRKYPLIDINMDRNACISYLKKRDLPIPVKSGCWLCPNRNWSYFEQLKTDYKVRFNMLIDLEENAAIRYPDNPPTLKPKKPMKNLAISENIEIWFDNIVDDQTCDGGYCFT